METTGSLLEDKYDMMIREEFLKIKFNYHFHHSQLLEGLPVHQEKPGAK